MLLCVAREGYESGESMREDRSRGVQRGRWCRGGEEGVDQQGSSFDGLREVRPAEGPGVDLGEGRALGCLGRSGAEE